MKSGQLKKEANLLALTGAGISAESGIVTFAEIPFIREKLTRSFANNHPLEYQEVLADLGKNIKGAKPNAAHQALASYQVPIITMNIDSLHQLAGSSLVINVHGDWPDIVLYEDPAPKYQQAIDLLRTYQRGDCLLVIGASDSTYFAVQMRIIAKSQGMVVKEIQEEAVRKVPEFLKAFYQ